MIDILDTIKEYSTYLYSLFFDQKMAEDGVDLDLEFKFSKYVDHLGEDGNDTVDFAESSGYIYVYPSADMGSFRDSSGNILPEGLRVDDLCGSHRVSLSGLKILKTSSCIGFSYFAHSRYQKQDFEMPCGTSVINLRDGILNTSRGTKAKATKKSTKRLTRKTVERIHHKIEFWETHLDPPVLKGSVEVDIICSRDENDFEFEDAEWMSYPKDREFFNLDLLDDYIRRAMSMFFDDKEDAYHQVSAVKYPGFKKYTASHPTLKKIHIPYYVVGIPEVRLPGFSYSWLRPRGDLNEDYYVNLIRSSLSLFDVREEEFLSEIESQFSRKDGKTSSMFDLCTNVIAGACCLYSQGQLYVPDHINRYNRTLGIPFDQNYISNCENMGVLRLTHGNDCEDMGCDNSMVAMVLKTHSGWSNPLTLACKRVLQQFMVLMANCAVSTRSAAESRVTSIGPNDLMSHVLCILVPNSRMVSMCRRTQTDHSLLGLADDSPNWNVDMGILFLEGTVRHFFFSP